MIWRALRLGLPVVGAELALTAGPAYFTWEHDQDGHDQAHLLCPICWMDKLVPVSGTSSAVAKPAAESPAG